ncbi:MAG: hypothetical protein RBU25_19820 [Lentisphaeria bacterium]|jgi:hypothetical protein|nr:hypothetical protein [Lentisphaeria bacterium]
MSVRIVLSASTAIAMLVLAGCATTTPPVGAVSEESSLSNEFKGSPAWVRTKACPDEKKYENLLCSVGTHQVLSARQMSLAQRTALSKARSAAALFIKGHVETLEISYEGEYTQGVEDAGADADSKARAYDEAWAKMDLPGFGPVDSWVSPNNNLYVLGTVNVETVMATLKGFAGLSDRQKTVIDDHEAEMRDLLKEKGM